MNRTFHQDQVNSVEALSDHNGQAEQTLGDGPFGESLGETGTSQNAMQYTGREQDAESGLYYYRARYYDPELGRFISEDSIGFEGGLNFYADEYGWVDVRHFGAADITEDLGSVIAETLGISVEVYQWFTESSGGYKSSFSPEDIPSNAAGAEIGDD